MAWPVQLTAALRRARELGAAGGTMRLHVRCHNCELEPDERALVEQSFHRALDQFERRGWDVVVKIERPNADHLFVCRATLPLDRQRPIVVSEEDRRMMTAVDLVAGRLAQSIEQRLHRRLHTDRVDGRERVRRVKEKLIRSQ